MPLNRLLLTIALAFPGSGLIQIRGLAQGQDVANRDLTALLDHPRILMPAKRSRLLTRERERESLRWNQFNLLIAGKVDMPEKGLAHSLYYIASQDQEQGRKAVDWALGPATDLRQLAIVFDWCQPLLKDAERTRLAAKLQSGLEKTAAAQDFSAVRNRVLAAVALSGHLPGVEAKYLQPILGPWWQKTILAPIASGAAPIDPKDHYALIEMLHVVRDNFDIDLRETAAKHFTTLPVYHLMSHYPAPFPAAENEYRIPLMKTHGEPDLREAIRSRAAALAMVAYDSNSQEMQFLQGWLIQDRFLMRSAYGIPYEFLWANPYQPGLSFHYLPNIFHDPPTGRLIVRSEWEDDATWYYQAAGQIQLFEGGQIHNLRQEAMGKPLIMGNTVLMPAALSAKFTIDTTEPSHYYLIGLKPDASYEIEVDDEEIRELSTDHGGILKLEFPAARKCGVRLRPVLPGSPKPA
ncbi:MAG: hypothetical protein JJE04_20280 [Acidobacteriia bacterium]|nr:hypothetical protein [Terriglobia bacterium]